MSFGENLKKARLAARSDPDRAGKEDRRDRAFHLQL